MSWRRCSARRTNRRACRRPGWTGQAPARGRARLQRHVGRENGLYREHCVHCHGITGDGLGPTGGVPQSLSARLPAGVFKFKSTYDASKPTDADLVRVLDNGIPGQFDAIVRAACPGEVEPLVEYVKYLSMRGEMEIAADQLRLQRAGRGRTATRTANILDEDGEPEWAGFRSIPRTMQNSGRQGDPSRSSKWDAAEEEVIIPIEERFPPM